MNIRDIQLQSEKFTPKNANKNWAFENEKLIDLFHTMNSLKSIPIYSQVLDKKNLLSQNAKVLGNYSPDIIHYNKQPVNQKLLNNLKKQSTF